MFGYLKLDNLASEEQKKYYKKAYCSLCKTLENYYGFLGRMTLSFDVTFLALLVQKEDLCINCKKIRCLGNKKKFNDKNLKKVAAINLMLFYKKLEDNYNDDNDKLSKILLRIYKRKVHKAINDYFDIWNTINSFYNNFAVLESNDANLDVLEDNFSDFMISLYEDNFPYKRKYSLALGYISKWIYLIDAIDDLDEDMKKGRFNPFLSPRYKNHRCIDDFINEYKKLIVNIKFDDSNLDKIIERIILVSIPLKTLNVMKG